MKTLILALLLVSTSANAYTCYGSDDCNRMRQQVIDEAHQQALRDAQERNERIRQEERMREISREMINKSKEDSRGWSY
jgi:hypothetical protein